MREVKPTDLIEHCIDLELHARPVYAKQMRYTRKEVEFSAGVFPEMEEAGIIMPPIDSQYLYLQIGQGLKEAPHTYSMFTDLVFGPLPPTPVEPAQPTIIGLHRDSSFVPFMDDHLGAGASFDSLFRFLHTVYFPRIVFGPVYLSGKKTFAFMASLEMVRFTATADRLRPSGKHRDKVLNLPTPQTQEELEAFIYLTLFLRYFIPGQAEHVWILKEAYQVAEDVLTPAGRVSTQKRWVDTNEFNWTPRQQTSFDYIKQSIQHNAIAGSDPDKQYYLATDANKSIPQMKVIMFMSYRLNDTKIRYSTTKREAPYPTKIYTDYTTLTSILSTGAETHGRVAR
ncbi:MAG: hypothetical protein M1826_005120 [Phylliscum demangeonii]|nr:MAG: hypothetical protein M1826_005120 [Phylliscum demangeonii]